MPTRLHILFDCGLAYNRRQQVTYGSGFVLGTEATGPLTVGGLAIPNQSFGSALLDQGFDDVDGIIG